MPLGGYSNQTLSPMRRDQKGQSNLTKSGTKRRIMFLVLLKAAKVGVVREMLFQSSGPLPGSY